MLGGYKRLAITVGAVALLAGTALGATALAQTPTPGTSTAQSAPARQNYRQVFLGKLATALGIDQAKLVSSAKQAAKDTLDEAVKNGDLGANQATRAKQRIDQAGPEALGPFGGPLGGPFGHGFRDGWQARGRFDRGAAAGMGLVEQAAADKLGMTVPELRTQLASGKSLSDVAKGKNVAPEDLQKAVVDAAKAQLDKAVQGGKLTQQRADQMLQQLQKGDWLNSAWGKKPARPAGPPKPTQ